MQAQGASPQIITRALNACQLACPVDALLAAPTVAEMVVIVVQCQTQRLHADELAPLLATVKALSDEQVQAQQLQERRRGGSMARG